MSFSFQLQQGMDKDFGERESEIYERLFFEMLIVILKGKKVQYKTYNTNKNQLQPLHVEIMLIIL